MMVALVVVGLLIGLGVGYYAAPVKEVSGETIYVMKNPLEGVTFSIGNIQSKNVNLEAEKPLVDEITLPDIRDYINKLGLDFDVEILVDSADSQVQIHLEKVQSFNSLGINNIIGGRWSSMAQGCLPYINSNDILMLSPCATSPLLAIEDDNLFRICVDDMVGAPAISEMIWSWGVKALVCLTAADAWGDGIYNVLETNFPVKGGVILERFRYAKEAQEFSNYLDQMDGIIENAIETYGVEHVAVLVIGTDEVATIITQASGYPSLYDVMWFGHESIGRNPRIIDSAGEQGVHLRLLSLMVAPATSWKWDSISDRFETLVGYLPPYEYISSYDAAWLFTLSAIETGDTDPMKIKEILPSLSSNYFGGMGWCDLNDAGDLKPTNYDIWGYATIDNKITFTKYGEYNFHQNKITWDLTSLSSQGLIPPGQ